MVNLIKLQSISFLCQRSVFKVYNLGASLFISKVSGSKSSRWVGSINSFGRGQFIQSFAPILIELLPRGQWKYWPLMISRDVRKLIRTHLNYKKTNVNGTGGEDKFKFGGMYDTRPTSQKIKFTFVILNGSGNYHELIKLFKPQSITREIVRQESTMP